MQSILEQFSLKGKNAFITGGSGLIGSQISQALASAGANVVILDVDQKKGSALAENICEQGYKADFVSFDMTRLEDVESKLNDFDRQYGGLHVWVNVSYPRTKDWGTSLEETSVDSMRQNVDLQLNSYSWLSRSVAVRMAEKKIEGSIINFASIYGVVGNDLTVYEGTKLGGSFVYAMIKGAVVNLTRYLASHFGEKNIRVNCISPGGVFDHQDPTFVKQYEKKVPLKRMGRSDEMNGAVLFLASDASSYVTGINIMVDGGWTAI